MSSISSNNSIFKNQRSWENLRTWKGSIPARNLFKSWSDKPKILPLKTFKVLIDEIFDSKFKFDERCKQIKQPLETMEQYLYTYLIQKYGLKSLVIDWMATIVNSINIYSQESNLFNLYSRFWSRYNIVWKDTKEWVRTKVNV